MLLDLKSSNMHSIQLMSNTPKAVSDIKNKHQDKFTDGSNLFHDNAPPAHRYQDQVNAMMWQEMFQYLTYSPNLTHTIFLSLDQLRKPSKAAHSHQMMTCRRLEYSSLWSCPGNSLQTENTDLHINGIHMEMPVKTFPNWCNTLTCDYPPTACSVTSLKQSQVQN